METAYVAVNGFVYREKTALPRRFSPSGSLTFRRALFHRRFASPAPALLTFAPILHISTYPIFFRPAAYRLKIHFASVYRDKVTCMFYLIAFSRTR